jgi:hypothetical protein
MIHWSAGAHISEKDTNGKIIYGKIIKKAVLLGEKSHFIIILAMQGIFCISVIIFYQYKIRCQNDRHDKL